MASTGKGKTTMAKLARESRLRERRLEKQARKDARKQAAAHPPGEPRDRSTGGRAMVHLAAGRHRRSEWCHSLEPLWLSTRSTTTHSGLIARGSPTSASGRGRF